MYVNKVLEVLRMIKLSIDARQFPPLIVVPVFGVLVAYATEVITTQGFIPPITPRYFLLTAFVFVVLLVFFYALTNRLWLSTLIVFCGAYALSYASFVKMEYRDEPLYFDDLSMTVKIFGFVDGDMVYATPYTAFPLIAGLAAIALVFVFSKVKTVGKGRLLTLAASAVCLSVLFFFAFFVPEHADAKDTGFVLGFISEPLHRDRDRAKQGDAPATENPSAPTDAQTDWGTPTTAAVPSEETPNVIIILSESFWDPYQMDNLTLSADPIPNFRRISETAVSGHLLSCTYAGGTDAVELSLLTGFTGRLLGVKGDVYDSWLLDNPATSLARVFWEKGYETRAVHTYHRDFYNRDIAFPKLGFGLFLGSEDMDITDSKGPYIDDKDLTRYILESYEDVAAKGRPAFILGISMQNHQSYGGRFESNPIHVVDDSMPEDLKDNVECYIHGLVDADVELGRIIDYFEGVSEPTVVLFFGDHQPHLGTSFELYRHTGNMVDPKNRTLDELRSILRTPFLIWSNYKDERASVENIDATLLGNLLLDYIGTEKPDFYHFLDTLQGHALYFSRMDLFYIDGDGVTRAPGDMPAETAALLEEYKRLVAEITG